MIGVLFALLATWDISVLGVLKNVLVVVLTKNVLTVIKNNKSVISIIMTLKMKLITISLLMISNPNILTNSKIPISRLMVVYLLMLLVSVLKMILVILTVPVMWPVLITWNVLTKDSSTTVTVTTSLKVLLLEVSYSTKIPYLIMRTKNSQSQLMVKNKLSIMIPKVL